MNHGTASNLEEGGITSSELCEPLKLPGMEESFAQMSTVATNCHASEKHKPQS